MRTTTIALGVLSAVLLVGSCGSDSQISSQPGAESTVDNGSGDSGSDGSTGDVDAPVDGGNQPSADLPGLPIGGQVPDNAFDDVGTEGCGQVAWTGPTIPDGVEIYVDFDLPEQVSQSNDSCPGSLRSCVGGAAFTPAESSCELGLRLESALVVDDDDSTSTPIGGSAHAVCATQQLCDEFGPTATDPSSAAVNGIPVIEQEPTDDPGSSDDGSDAAESEDAE